VRVYFSGPLFTPYERGFIDACAARLRDEGFEVYVPHEHVLATGDETPAAIFAKDWEGLTTAEAMLALLDGTAVDDGTACEIGLFHGLMQVDPAKRGVVGLLTDMRRTRGGGHDVNLFVRGCIDAGGGCVVGSLDDAVSALRRLRADG
jgi:Nucleoside 2-deoxyribosyltransferase